MILRTYSELHVGMSEILHAGFGLQGFLTRDHLDEGVALVTVDDAGLNSTKSRKDRLQLVFIGLTATESNCVSGLSMRWNEREPTLLLRRKGSCCTLYSWSARERPGQSRESEIVTFDVALGQAVVVLDPLWPWRRESVILTCRARTSTAGRTSLTI